MSKVTLKGWIVVPEAELALVKKALKKHIKLTHAEKGCLVFQVCQRMEQPSYFDVYEEFVDESAFLNHQHRVSTSEWGEITKNVERHYTVDKAKG